MAATTVDTLLVRIEADMSGIRRDLRRLEQTTQSSTKKMQGAFAGLSRFVGPAIGVAFVGALAAGSKSVIALASDVEEMQAKSDVVFGAFAGQVREQLAQFGDEVGRSRFELEGMASSIQDTFVPMGFARGEAADLSVQLTKLATDVASFNNASDTETMAAFQSALVGNHETVRRFGVVITEATLKQELMRMGITKNMKEVTNAEKVQARLNLLMAGTTDAQGDAARTADSFANQARALNASLVVLGKEIGDELLPNATQLLGVFNRLVGATTKFLAAVGIIKLDDVKQLNVIAQKRLDLLEEEKAAQIIANNQVALDNMLVKINERRLKLDNEEAAIQQRLAGILRTNYENKHKDIEASKEKNEVTTTTISDAQKEINSIQQRIKMAELEVKSRGGVSEATKEYIQLEHQLKDATGGEKEEIKGLLNELSILEQKRALQIMNQEALTEHYQKQKDAQDATKDSLQELRDEAASFRLENSGLTEAQKMTTQFILENKNATSAQIEEYQKLAEEITNTTTVIDEELNPMMQELMNSTLQAGQSIASSFADMLVDGQMSLDGLQDVFKNFVKQMLAKAIELMVINRIMNSIFKNVSGFTPLPTMGFAGGGSVGGFAGGGAVRSPVLVGERGPELFVPHSAGVVKNNMDTKNMLGGGGTINIYQTLNVETGVAQTVRAEIANFIPVIKQDTIKAVAEARRRGGNFANAFGG